MFGVEADQQDRVAVRRVAFCRRGRWSPTRRSEPRIRNVCGPPLYSGVTTPFGALIWLSFGNTSSAIPLTVFSATVAVARR